MANRYWVGGSGEWSDSSHWSATSGGSGGASVPTSSDDTFFDSNSDAGSTISIVAGYDIPTRALSFNTDVPLRFSAKSTGSFISFNIYGPLTYNTTADFRDYVGYRGLSFYQMAGSTTIGVQNSTLQYAEFNAWNAPVIFDIDTTVAYLQCGFSTLNLGGNSVTTKNISHFRTGTLTIGSGTLTILGPVSSDISSNINAPFGAINIKGGATSFGIVNVQNLNVSGGATVNMGGTITARKCTLTSAILRSDTSGVTRSLVCSPANQIIAAQGITLKDVAVSGQGIYYTGAGATNGGNNSGWTWSDAPKLDSFSDLFSGSNIDSSKWAISAASGGAVSQNDGKLLISGSGSSATATVRSKNHYVLEGSSVNFYLDRNLLGAGSGIFYLARAAQYGTTAQRDIPDIYLSFSQSSTTWFVVGASIYSKSVTLTGNRIRFRESGGTLYLESAVSNSFVVNDSIKLSNYGIESRQLTSQPEFTYTPSSGGTFIVSEFNALLPPSANFTFSAGPHYLGDAIQFTDASTGEIASRLWDFGDGTTSTAQNPTKTYSVAGTYTVSLTVTGTNGSTTKSVVINIEVFKLSLSFKSANQSDSSIDMNESGSLSISSIDAVKSSLMLRSKFSVLPQKDYEYRVFDHDGNFISIWDNVVSEFGYTQKIGENASALPVQIGRNPDNKQVRYEALQDETGEDILDEGASPIIAPVETPNAVGAGTDVQENLNVDVYAFYGGYEAILDEARDEILDQNGDAILAPFGAPNGKRVYSGYILDYELTYGDQTGVAVTVVPHGTELSDFVFKSGNNTTIKYLNTDPVKMARDAMNSYNTQGGVVEYDITSMPLSGQSTDYDFKLQTIKEVLDKSVELMPAGWYHYPHPGENKEYFLEKSETKDHTFIYEKHISTLKLKKTIVNLVNDVYFTGGEIGDDDNKTTLFKHYDDHSSIENIRRGLLRLSDSRVTLDESARILSERNIEEFKVAKYQTTVTISDAVYDIENIRLGQNVGFYNFGTFVDSLVLQIAEINRGKHEVTLGLETSLTSEGKRLETMRRQIEQEQIRNIGDYPS